jgi:hypothetical protein
MKQAVDNCLPIIKLINEGVEKKANAELKAVRHNIFTNADVLLLYIILGKILLH